MLAPPCSDWSAIWTGGKWAPSIRSESDSSLPALFQYSSFLYRRSWAPQLFHLVRLFLIHQCRSSGKLWQVGHLTRATSHWLRGRWNLRTRCVPNLDLQSARLCSGAAKRSSLLRNALGRARLFLKDQLIRHCLCQFDRRFAPSLPVPLFVASSPRCRWKL